MKLLFCFSTFFISAVLQAQTMEFNASGASAGKGFSSTAKSPSREQIDSEKIKDLGVISPAEALEDSSQIQVVGSSVFGQTRSISIRGAPSSYTSIVWNGIKMNDWLAPSANAEGSQGGQEFSGKVTIVKGPQTLRRSSSAIAGMVEYQLDPDDRYIQLTGSDKNIHRESLEYSIERKNSFTGLGGSFSQSDYASAYDRQKLNAQQRDSELEKDRYQQYSGSFINRYQWNPEVRFQVLLHQQSAQSADDSGSNDDPNAMTTRSNQIISGMVEFPLVSWRSFFRWDHQINSIFFENPPDRFETSRSVTANDGVSDRLQWGVEHEWRRSDLRQSLSLGIENLKEQGLFYADSFGQKSRFDRQMEQTESYGIHEVEWGSFDVSYGLRSSGKNTALQSQLQYHFANGLSPYVIASRGYKDPSLYQLYSTYGNQNLNSESSRAAEIGTQFRTSAGDEFQIGYFRYDFENLITFNNTTMKYENIEKAKSEGMEFLAGFSPWDVTENTSIKMETSYQKLDSVNLETKQRTVRVPQDSAKMLLQLNPERKLATSLTARYIGEREDFDGANKKTLPKVLLIHVATRWKMDLKNELSFRVENAGNQPYEEVWGYTPTGRIFILTYRRFL